MKRIIFAVVVAAVVISITMIGAVFINMSLSAADVTQWSKESRAALFVAVIFFAVLATDAVEVRND